MLYPNESPFIVSVQPRVDLYEIEHEVERAFTEVLGEDQVLGVYANEYPSRIGVTLFLRHHDNGEVKKIKDRIEENLAVQGLRVGILVLPASMMKDK